MRQGHDLSDSFDQLHESIVFTQSQRQRQSFERNLSVSKIDQEVAGARVARARGSASNQRVRVRGELIELEWHHEYVVGTCT